MKKFFGKILHGLATGISFILNFITDLLGVIVSLFEGIKEVFLGFFSLGCIFFFIRPRWNMPRRLYTLILLILLVPTLGTPIISRLRYANFTLTEWMYDKADTMITGHKVGYEKFSDYSNDYKARQEAERRKEAQRRQWEQEQARQRQQEEWTRRFEEFAKNFRYYDPNNFGNYGQGDYYGQGGYSGYNQAGYGPTGDLGFKEKYEKSCDILGVSYDSDTYQIKLNYRKLAKKYHPDINKAPDATEKFQEINDAYDFLSEENINKYKNLYG